MLVEKIAGDKDGIGLFPQDYAGQGLLAAGVYGIVQVADHDKPHPGIRRQAVALQGITHHMQVLPEGQIGHRYQCQTDSDDPINQNPYSLFYTGTNRLPFTIQKKEKICNACKSSPAHLSPSPLPPSRAAA